MKVGKGFKPTAGQARPGDLTDRRGGPARLHKLQPVIQLVVPAPMGLVFLHQLMLPHTLHLLRHLPLPLQIAP